MVVYFVTFFHVHTHLGAFLMTVFGRQVSTSASSLVMCITIFLVPSLYAWTPSSWTSFTKLLVYLFAGLIQIWRDFRHLLLTTKRCAHTFCLKNELPNTSCCRSCNPFAVCRQMTLIACYYRFFKVSMALLLE